jgi:putative protein-disulfide isomerase
MNPTSEPTPPTIVYGNDPFCGWCFAIGPSLNQARKLLAGEVNWRIECGGLVTGERVRPIALDREYLVAGFKQVNAASGRVPGDKYWKRIVEPGTWVSDSEPVCRAVLVAQMMAPSQAMEFSHGLSDALYLDGEAPDDADTLRRVATEHQIDPDELLQRWSSPVAAEMVHHGFARARALGVTTYPSLFLEVGSDLHPLVSGYASAEQIVTKVRAAIQLAAHPHS